MGAVREALRHPSYVLLTCGFFVCGFHIAFVTTHLPPYLTDSGMSHGVAALALGMIGLFNVLGAYMSGVLGGIAQPPAAAQRHLRLAGGRVRAVRGAARLAGHRAAVRRADRPALALDRGADFGPDRR